MKQRKRHSPGEIEKAASQYTHRSEWQEHDPQTYFFAYRRGLLDNYCSHMEPSRRLREKKWKDEELYEIGGRFNNHADFIENEPGAYTAAYRRGLIDDICSDYAAKRKDRPK